MENNKKPLLIGGAIALAAVAFMLGSSNGTTNNTAPSPEISADTWTPEPAPAYTDDELFLNTVNGYGNSVIANIADSDLLEMGYQVCSVLDEGYTIEDIVNEFIYNSSLSTDAEFEAVGLIVGSAVRNLCPEYVSMVESYL